MRIAPIDPETKVAKVGIKTEVYKPEFTMEQLQPRILKERIGYSGGFKIPEEYRKSRDAKLSKMLNDSRDGYSEARDQSLVTKEEIL